MNDCVNILFTSTVFLSEIQVNEKGRLQYTMTFPPSSEQKPIHTDLEDPNGVDMGRAGLPSTQ